MSAVAWILGLFGLAALLLAVSRLVAAEQLAAGYAALAVLLVCASVVTALAADLASYQPRDRDRPIAEIYFEQVGTARYRATVTRLPARRAGVRTGERPDARTIEFGGWARAIGGRAGYRLERLVAVRQTSGKSVASATGDYGWTRAMVSTSAGVAAQHTLGRTRERRPPAARSCR